MHGELSEHPSLVPEEFCSRALFLEDSGAFP